MSKLFSIALILLALAVLQRGMTPTPARADSEYSHFWVEPGVTVIRTPAGDSKFQGKMMIDMRTGEIWGFPTLAGVPYPLASTTQSPPVSRPVYLGKFDLAAARR